MLNRILSELHESLAQKRTVVFCGAGISVASGIPTVGGYDPNRNEFFGLLPHILQTLSLNATLLKKLLDENLPFESYFETFHDHSKITALLDIFQQGHANTTHTLLAKLFIDGYLKIICTTNFDLLLEHALNQQGWNCGSHYRMLKKNQEFLDGGNQSKLPLLIKIHGCISDGNEIDITLRQISSGLLTKGRKQVIHNLFSDNNSLDTVLVMGYSCSDVFDLVPLIRSVPMPKARIFFVNHTPHASDFAAGRMADGTCHIPAKVTTTFKDFPNSHWINYDTDQLIHELGQHFYATFTPKTPLIDFDWRHYVLQWSTQFETPSGITAKSIVISELLNKANCLDDSAKFLENAAPFAAKTGEKVAIYDNLGIVYCKQGKFRQAIFNLEKSLSLQAVTSQSVGRADAYHNLGMAYLGLGSYQQAETYYHKAILMLNDMDHEIEMNASLGLARIAMERGRHKDAERILCQTLDRSDQIGAIQIKIACWDTLGVLYQRMGHYDTAELAYKTAMEMARLVGNRHQLANSHFNLGVIEHHRGQWNIAIRCFENALEVQMEIKNKKGEAECYINLGACCLKTKQPHLGLAFLRKGEQLYEVINNQEGLAQSYLNLGLVYSEIGLPQLALDYYTRCCAYFEKEKKIDGLLSVFINIASAHIELQQFQQAQHIIERTHELCKTLPERNVEVEIYCCINLSVVYTYLSLFSQALEILEKINASIHYQQFPLELHGDLLFNLGVAHHNLKHVADARTMYLQAIEVYEKLTPRATDMVDRIRLNLERLDRGD